MDEQEGVPGNGRRRGSGNAMMRRLLALRPFYLPSTYMVLWREHRAVRLGKAQSKE